MKEKILIVDDEESIRYTFQSFLEEAGYVATAARDYDEALELLAAEDFDLIFIDIILDGKTGIDLLKNIKDKKIASEIVIITGAPALETASEALRLGALDYIVKPVRQETLLRASAMALRHKALTDAKECYRMNMEAILRSIKDGIISVDRKMRVVEMNDAAARICQIRHDQAGGKPLADLALSCGRACLNSLNETLTQQLPVEGDPMECHAAGRTDQMVGITVSPLLNRQNDFTGGVMVIRDQTHLMRLERSLKVHQEFERIIGKSPEIQKIFQLIKVLANVRTHVLITGESGTGKELVADAIHASGDRNGMPMVKVNCSALAESLLESELFGHVRGAFTGAVDNKIGWFQRADGGTIFLDEIGDISPGMQTRFLRVLENMEIDRVGETRPIRVDVRVIAATNRNLQEKVLRNEFREDLYYRLKVFGIKLPSLRDRRDDIPLLIKHFLLEFNQKFQKDIKAVSSDVQRIFMSYPWPGNVRELKNTLEHAFILCDRQIITVDDLPPDFSGDEGAAARPFNGNAEIDESAILDALTRASGNRSQAAKLLGISRRTIYRKMHHYHLLK